MSNFDLLYRQSRDLGRLMGIISAWSHDANLLLNNTGLDDETRDFLEHIAQFETILDIDTSELQRFVMARRRT